MKFELKPYNRNTSNQELISDVKKVVDEINKNTITIHEYNKRGKIHATTLTRRFGNWFKVLELAGLQKTRSPLNISEENLFQDLEELWVKLGRQPNYSEMRKPLSKYSSHTFVNRFGSWRKGLEIFVSYINSEENASSEEAIRNL